MENTNTHKHADEMKVAQIKLADKLQSIGFYNDDKGAEHLENYEHDYYVTEDKSLVKKWTINRREHIGAGLFARCFSTVQGEYKFAIMIKDDGRVTINIHASYQYQHTGGGHNGSSWNTRYDSHKIAELDAFINDPEAEDRAKVGALAEKIHMYEAGWTVIDTARARECMDLAMFPSTHVSRNRNEY